MVNSPKSEMPGIVYSKPVWAPFASVQHKIFFYESERSIKVAHTTIFKVLWSQIIALKEHLNVLHLNWL